MNFLEGLFLHLIMYMIVSYQSEISKLPGLYLLRRTVTYLNYLISSMYNCYISRIRKLPEFQSNYLGVLGKQSTNGFRT